MQEISKYIWDAKYRFKKPDGSSTEKNINDTHARVCDGTYINDTKLNRDLAEHAMQELLWNPAGRNHAGAGTGRRVTLINCFASPIIQDSMETNSAEHGMGILDALKVAALTQQMGGGIGMDFSPLRPNGAIVKGVGSISSGPMHFMDMWDAMCKTIMSSGSRRGAMMGVMSIIHPDICEFIKAKREKGRLTNFNISILITDKFMDAVKNDIIWELYFHVPRADDNHISTFEDDNGITQYVYQEIKAVELWDEIIRSTYEYAEPGVIFIDKVNEWNNLYYCEDLQCTNPCGEQPLPPDGDCNLGSVNLAKMVDNPFSAKREFNFVKLEHTIKIGVRFLDNIIDVSIFPTMDQQYEAQEKRRIGLGITGLGNMLQQMELKYGSVESLNLVRKVMVVFRDTAYKTSALLAKERGSFPCYDKEKYIDAMFIQTLPTSIRSLIQENGIRNSVLLTIAPTGTTSIYYDNVSSGIEPSFAWTYNRNVLNPDGSYKEFTGIEDYGYALYKKLHPEVQNSENLPNYMVTALELNVEEHLSMQAVCQEYIDASISKTINCPKDMSFDEFKKVYYIAYDRDCKGCTTYRPSATRGAVLSLESDDGPTGVPIRPALLHGTTYKAKWPTIKQALYVTINDYVDEEGTTRPFEVFINSKSVKHQEWVTALTRCMSAVFRKGGDISFLIEELEQVHSSTDGHWYNKVFTPSIPAMIGGIIKEHLYNINYLERPKNDKTNLPLGEICPQCNMPHLIKIEGCDQCHNCGYSNCG